MKQGCKLAVCDGDKALCKPVAREGILNCLSHDAIGPEILIIHFIWHKIME